MPYTDAERVIVQRRIFGCTAAELETIVDAQHPRLKIALSVLSDAQELIQRGQTEDARQAINRAKYMINAAENRA
jgi:Cdc6-like AAA superfamily ATPase